MGRQRFQVRRDTAANWASVNPVLLDGEYGRESDTDKVKIGDGVTVWNALAYESYSIPKSFEFNQPTPSQQWVINHNLGFKPAVELFNTGSQEIEGDVVHVSINQTVVSFTLGVAGFARLS